MAAINVVQQMKKTPLGTHGELEGKFKIKLVNCRIMIIFSIPLQVFLVIWSVCLLSTVFMLIIETIREGLKKIEIIFMEFCTGRGGSTPHPSK